MAISKSKGPRKTQQYTLPSMGYKYPKEFPGGKVGVHSFNFDVEQILAGDADGQLKMNQITPLVIDLPEGFKVGELLVADQFYLLMAARAMSFGEEYSFTTVCPTCGALEKHLYTLPDGLPVNVLPPDFKEPLEFELPGCKDIVGIRFLTIDDEMMIANYAKQRKANHPDAGDPGYKCRLAKHIVHVNEEKPTDLNDAIDYVAGLDGRDPAEFRYQVDTKSPGIRPLLKVQCPKDGCGVIYDAVFRVTAEFFRPQRQATD